VVVAVEAVVVAALWREWLLALTLTLFTGMRFEVIMAVKIQIMFLIMTCGRLMGGYQLF
jgi:hypothetical protein